MGEVDRSPEVAPIGPLPEQATEPPRLAFDLTGKTPDEIVGMHREICGVEYDGPDDLVDGLTSAFMFGMEDLCVARPDLAADALEILATNAVDCDERRTASMLVEKLAGANPKAALILAETLLRDPDTWVRIHTREAVGAALKAGAFTPTDALHLFRIYHSVDNTDMGDAVYGQS